MAVLGFLLRIGLCPIQDKRATPKRRELIQVKVKVLVCLIKKKSFVPTSPPNKRREPRIFIANQLTCLITALEARHSLIDKIRLKDWGWSHGFRKWPYI